MGRPRLLWIDDAENDLRELKMKRPRKRPIVEKNMHLPRLLRQRKVTEKVDN
jgi:hypothetical protein